MESLFDDQPCPIKTSWYLEDSGLLVIAVCGHDEAVDTFGGHSARISEAGLETRSLLPFSNLFPTRTFIHPAAHISRGQLSLLQVQ